MKKLITFLAFASLCIIIASCGGADDEQSSATSFFGISEISHISQPSIPDTTEQPSEVFNPQSSEEESSQPQTSEIVPESYKGFTYTHFDPLQTTQLIDKISEIIDKAGYNISLYIIDLNTDAIISYKADDKYRSASVIKAPYMYYLLASDVDLLCELEMKSYHIMDGSGVLKNNPVGSKYTVKQLIEYSLKNSDNTAYYMLYEKFGFDGFNQYCQSLGIGTKISSADYLGYMSAREATIFMQDIYALIDAGGEKSQIMYNSMTNATYTLLLPGGIKNKPVAHKFGLMTGAVTVYHDVGIVYGENPYIISIMTDCNRSKFNGVEEFVQISSLIDKFFDDNY